MTFNKKEIKTRLLDLLNNFNMVSDRSIYKDETLYDESVDQLCDIKQSSFGLCNEEQSLVLRERLGINKENKPLMINEIADKLNQDETYIQTIQRDACFNIIISLSFRESIISPQIFSILKGIVKSFQFLNFSI